MYSLLLPLPSPFHISRLLSYDVLLLFFFRAPSFSTTDLPPPPPAYSCTETSFRSNNVPPYLFVCLGLPLTFSLQSFSFTVVSLREFVFVLLLNSPRSSSPHPSITLSFPAVTAWMPPSQRLENKKRTERVFLLSLLLLWDVFLFFLLLFVGRSCFFSDRSASIPLPVFTCSPTAPLSLHLCRLYLFCITRTHTPCVCMCVRVRSCPSALLFICVSPMSEARHASRSHLRRIYFISSRTRTRAHGQLCESLCVLDLLLLMLCARADIVHVSPPLPLPSLSPLTPRNRHIKALCKAKNRQARGKEEEAAGRRERERKKIIQLLFPCVCADRLVLLLFFSPLPSLPHSLSHKHGLFLSLFFFVCFFVVRNFTH